jgi:putative transposase
MTAKCTAQLLADLGVTRSLSRPHVSDDNPFSEAQFKTLKYAPAFPGRFGGYEQARSFCRPFFDWYNNEHRHSGIAMLTPQTVHAGRSDEVLAQRQAALDVAFAVHPERFPRGAPTVGQLPEAVWINPPPPAEAPTTESTTPVHPSPQQREEAMA